MSSLISTHLFEVLRLSKSKIEVFDKVKSGEVIVGYYKGVNSDFLYSVENDMFTWFYSSTLGTWFKKEEINFA